MENLNLLQQFLGTKKPLYESGLDVKRRKA